MNKLISYLQQPAPRFEKPWLIILITLVMAAFIIGVFEPFNFRLNSPGQWILLMGFLFVIGIGTLFSFIFLPRIFRHYYRPDNWTVGKDLLHYFVFLSFTGVLVVIFEMIIIRYVFNMPQVDFSSDEAMENIIIDLVATFSVGIIPIIVTVIMTKNHALKQNLQEALQLNEMLSKRVSHENGQDENVTLSGSTKDSLTVIPENIIYIEASGNYTEVHYIDKEIIHNKLLRATIRQMEEQLQPYSTLIRCHRAFIVNVNQIRNVKGNAQGYKLNLHHITTEVPVSRTYIKNLREVLS